MNDIPDEQTVCDNCGEPLTSEKAMFVDGQALCRECYEDYMAGLIY